MKSNGNRNDPDNQESVRNEIDTAKKIFIYSIAAVGILAIVAPTLVFFLLRRRMNTKVSYLTEPRKNASEQYYSEPIELETTVCS